MTTPQTASIFLRNDTGDVADLVLSHQYSSSAVDAMAWTQVQPGATVGPLVVHFETGLGSGLDRWFAMATVGTDTRRRVFTTRGTRGSPGKYCTLMDGDHSVDHTFGLSIATLAINLKSGSCTARMLLQGTVTPKVTNVFVLMLENRSFDHLFGWFRPDANYPPVEGLSSALANTYQGQQVHVRALTSDQPASADPGHEFKDVWLQLTGTAAPDKVPAGYPKIDNSGFAASYADHCQHWRYGAVPTDDAHLGEVMSGAAMSRQLVIHQLAAQFALCDHWFSSLPGPTWPNRFFALAASSGGLDDSPSKADLAFSQTFGRYVFPRGTIFSALTAAGCTWRIYQDRNNMFGHASMTGAVAGAVPISAAMPGVSKANVRTFNSFAADLQDTYTPQFTFIEPHYGNTADETYRGGSSQHPTDTMAAGEALIAATYQAIRQSPIWGTSLLIITYDEHGGYYDHMPPPPAPPPGDLAVGTGASTHSFDFSRLGVRVPTVVISPWIKPRTVVSTVFDHSSIIRTVLRLFVGDDIHLTDRDKNANDLLALLTPNATTAPPTVTLPTTPPNPPAPPPPADPLPPSGNIIGFLQQVHDIDLDLTDGSDTAAAEVTKQVTGLTTFADADAYIAAVLTRAQQADDDAALVARCTSAPASASDLSSLAALLGMQPAEVTTLANALIAAQLAQRFHDLALCNDEIADLLRAAHRTETNGRMLTDDDGTSFAIPAGTSVAASALVEVPIAS